MTDLIQVYVDMNTGTQPWHNFFKPLNRKDFQGGKSMDWNFNTAHQACIIQHSPNHEPIQICFTWAEKEVISVPKVRSSSTSQEILLFR